MFDIGGKNDKSFNEAAWRGLAARARRARRRRRSTSSRPRARIARPRCARWRRASVDLVIGVGFIFGPDLERLARAVSRREVRRHRLLAVGRGVGTLPNLAGLRFREQEGSFVVGAIAALLTRHEDRRLRRRHEDPADPQVRGRLRRRASHHVCPDVPRAVGVRRDRAEGVRRSVARRRSSRAAQYAQGADVIFHAAGKTGDGVFAAARAARGARDRRRLGSVRRRRRAAW